MRVAAALALVLASSIASAGVYTHRSAPVFSTVLPERIVPVFVPEPPRELLASWRRASDGVVIQFIDLGAALPQRALTHDEQGALRRSDPRGLVFTDALEHPRALGFSLDALVGHAHTPTGDVVRFAVAVPTTPDAVLVTVLAPAAHETDARQIFASVLTSFHAVTPWRTVAQQRWMAAGTLAGRVAVALTAVYAMLAFGMFRRDECAPLVRTVALAVIAFAWTVMARGMLARPEHPRAAVALVLVVAVATALSAIKQGRSWQQQRGSHGRRLSLDA